MSLFLSTLFRKTFMLQLSDSLSTCKIGPNFWAPLETGSTIAIMSKATTSSWGAGILMALEWAINFRLGFGEVGQILVHTCICRLWREDWIDCECVVERRAMMTVSWSCHRLFLEKIKRYRIVMVGYVGFGFLPWSSSFEFNLSRLLNNLSPYVLLLNFSNKAKSSLVNSSLSLRGSITLPLQITARWPSCRFNTDLE